MPPETAHSLGLQALHWVPSWSFSSPKSKPVHCMGMDFRHPLGLAAGLDKDGQHVSALAKLGFSFLEIGTVTPQPQIGNPKPRLFRLPSDEALINRMGFNNQGVARLAQRLSGRDYAPIIGINIGKNKDTSLDDAAKDYCLALSKVYPVADYVTINISSPNTPDLRRLQEEDFFSQLLTQITAQRERLAQQYQRALPLAIKISPDESDERIKRLCAIALSNNIEAIIATNTTSERASLIEAHLAKEAGGLSGKPLQARACLCLSSVKAQVGNAISLIGVGGIDSAKSAQARLDAGADLLQLYTGLIYQGPGLVSRIVNQLH